MHRAFVALGSNLDDPEARVRAGFDALAALPGTRLLRSSRLFRTPPWGLTDQPWFVNAAAELATSLSPQQLMTALQGIEREAGRSRSGERWGPRRLDLDLLLHGEHAVDDPDLQLPHPRMAERGFVLLPLADIAPDLVLPDGRALVDLLMQVDVAGIEPLP